MPGGDFFGGLIEGFGGALLKRQQDAITRGTQEKTQLANLYLEGMKAGVIDEETGIRLVSEIISSAVSPGLVEGFMGKPTKKKSGGPIMDMIGDPDQLGDFLKRLSGATSQLEAGQGGEGQGALPAAPTPSPAAGETPTYGPLGSPSAMIPESVPAPAGTPPPIETSYSALGQNSH